MNIVKKISTGYVPVCMKCLRSYGVVCSTLEEAEQYQGECVRCNGGRVEHEGRVRSNQKLQASVLFQLIDETHDFEEAARRYGYTGHYLVGTIRAALRRCGWKIALEYDRDGQRITWWQKDETTRETKTVIKPTMQRKFSEDDIKKMVEMAKNGEPYKVIAAEFGISMTAARGICAKHSEEHSL